MKTVVLKGCAEEMQSVHSSVRLPADIHAYAKRRGINLSATLAATIAAFRDDEEKNGTGKMATNLTPVPAAQCNPRENHDDTSLSGGMGK